MPYRSDVLQEREFWAYLFASGFQFIEEAPLLHDYYSILQVNEHEAIEWWHELNGWDPNIIAESDGYVDDPAKIRIDLANDIKLEVELHPGDDYWILSDGVTSATFANLGPHPVVPGLRWQEVSDLATVSKDDGWHTALLLLPVTWITDGDDEMAALSFVKSIWQSSKLVDGSTASELAEQWMKAMANGKEYAWRKETVGWVCDAPGSSRNERCTIEELVCINRLIDRGSSCRR